jgi:error-prone DNA polymerase
MSPYADVKPAGDDAGTAARKAAAAAPRKLWHSSPGSPGH